MLGGSSGYEIGTLSPKDGGRAVVEGEGQTPQRMINPSYTFSNRKLHDTLLLYPTMRMLTSTWILGQERREEDQR